jgi:hypothetical protein
MAAPTIIDSLWSATDSITPASLTMADDDHVLYFAFGRANRDITAGPTDFDVLVPAFTVNNGNATGIECAVWVKEIPSAAAETTPWTHTWTLEAFGGCMAVVVRGWSGTLDEYLTDSTDTQSVVAAPQVTTLGPDRRIISFVCMNTGASGTAQIWSPDNHSEIEDDGDRLYAAIGHTTQAVAGLSTLESWTTTGAVNYALAITLALGALQDPTPNAGADYEADPGEYVTLDASGSTGTGTLSYAWSQLSGTGTAILDADDVAEVNFNAPVGPDVLVFQVDVTGDLGTESDTVTITVTTPVVESLSIPILVRQSGEWV